MERVHVELTQIGDAVHIKDVDVSELQRAVSGAIERGEGALFGASFGRALDTTGIQVSGEVVLATPDGAVPVEGPARGLGGVVLSATAAGIEQVNANFATRRDDLAREQADGVRAAGLVEGIASPDEIQRGHDAINQRHKGKDDALEAAAEMQSSVLSGAAYIAANRLEPAASSSAVLDNLVDFSRTRVGAARLADETRRGASGVLGAVSRADHPASENIANAFIDASVASNVAVDDVKPLLQKLTSVGAIDARIDTANKALRIARGSSTFAEEFGRDPIWNQGTAGRIHGGAKGVLAALDVGLGVVDLAKNGPSIDNGLAIVGGTATIAALWGVPGAQPVAAATTVASLGLSFWRAIGDSQRRFDNHQAFYRGAGFNDDESYNLATLLAQSPADFDGAFNDGFQSFASRVDGRDTAGALRALLDQSHTDVLRDAALIGGGTYQSPRAATSTTAKPSTTSRSD